MKGEATLLSARDLPGWDREADVVIVGYGIAGACAALEAHRAGADVLLIERASGGGGTSMLSSGIFYLGGGTALQRDLGVADDPQQMFQFLQASAGVPDIALLRTFCDRSAEHFDWLEAQGVPFRREMFKDKAVCPATPEGLLSTGNEKVWPYREVATPAMRGHRVDRAGDNAGSLAMEQLIARCTEAGIPLIADARVDALVTDGDGRIVGIRARSGERTLHIRARRGVVLATGGFQMNRAMVETYLPALSGNSEPIGVPYNDGAGVALGRAAGAALRGMRTANVTASFYPPSKLIKGIVVNAAGERFVAEDSYHGRTAGMVMEQPGGLAYLILDAETFAYPEAIEFFRHRFVDGWESVAEMEAGLNLPEGSLQRTMDRYNAAARRGEDPELGKHPDWLKPLDVAPFAAFDISLNEAVHRFHTLGGLAVDAKARVVSESGHPIAGLYAAGACAASIPQDGKAYASGMTLAAGSLFGRIAGAMAAAPSP